MKLQIVIPTRGKSKTLSETLASIVPQLTAECDVLVVDDPVDGFDKAYLNAIWKAEADYVWLFSDDDILLPGAVEQVLTACNRGSKLIVANACVMDQETTTVLKNEWVSGSAGQVFNNPSAALMLYGDLMSYVGSIIINRHVWNVAAQCHAEKFIGTRFITFALPAIAALDDVEFVNHVCSAARYGHQEWCADSARLMEKFRDIVWSLDVSEEAKQAVAPRSPALWKCLLWHATGVPMPESLPAKSVKWLPKEWVRRVALAGMALAGLDKRMSFDALWRAK